MGKRNGKALQTLEGICNFYFETGTEGGYWAFQDERYIQKNVPRGYCKNCGLYLREQEGALRVERIYPVDEAFLRSGELTERPDCPNNKHEEEFGDVWDYDGLHILADGDQLTIYNPQKRDEVVWSGLIELLRHPLFTETASEYWIHFDQKGIERDVWAKYFFEEYPARLVMKR